MCAWVTCPLSLTLILTAGFVMCFPLRVRGSLGLLVCLLSIGLMRHYFVPCAPVNGWMVAGDIGDATDVFNHRPMLYDDSSSVVGCRCCHDGYTTDGFDGRCCDAVSLKFLGTGENLGEISFIIGIGCIAFPQSRNINQLFNLIQCAMLS